MGQIRKLRGWASLIALSILPGAGSAQTAKAPPPPDGFVRYILDRLNSFSFDVEDPTNRPPPTIIVPDGVLTAIEVNSDGRPDWLIRWPEASQFCGTGGCEATLYISTEDGFVRALDRQVLSLEIRSVAGTAQIEAELHQLECNEGQEVCLRAWGWDQNTKHLEVRTSSDGIAPPISAISAELISPHRKDCPPG